MSIDLKPKEQEEPLLESPHDMLLAEHSADELLHWQAPEFERREKSRRWYLAVSFLLAAIVLYAVFKNGPVMAITFIMLGVTGYLMLMKEPRILDFRITPEGVSAGNDLFLFENVQSFWIFYDPPHEKILSLHLKHSLVPFIHIPIDQQDPVEVRKILLRFIPELKQEKTLVDTVERILGM